MAIEERKLKEKLNRYNAILSAAEEIMKTSGVNGLNMDLVAKKTELAKGTLYLYFKSKEEILAALSIKARTLLLTHFIKSTNKSDNPIEQLKAISYANFNFFKKYTHYFELIAIYEVNNKFEETPEIKQSTNNLIHFVNSITIRAKESGYLNSSLDPIKYTFCLWGMLIGMCQMLQVRGKLLKNEYGFTEKDIINTFMSQLEEGMVK